MTDLVSELRKVANLKGDTYSSMEVFGITGRAADEIERLQAGNACLRDLLRETSDDLESEVEGHYRDIKDHPAITPKYDRDMEIVTRARLYLNSQSVSDEQSGDGAKDGR